MSNVKKRTHITVNEKTHEEIKRLAKLNNNVSYSYIVQRGMDYYIEHQGKQYPELYAVLENLMLPIYEELEKLRVSSNEANRDLSMLLEFWNHYFATKNEHEFVTTENNKTHELSFAKDLVDQRIESKRIKKLSRGK